MKEGIISKDTFKPVNMWKSSRRTLILTLKSSPATVLLLVVPFALAAGNVDWPPVAVFVLNFVAIVPLAAVLCFCTEELAEHFGNNIGALLNASFGNAVELIIAVIALKKKEIRVVQTSMLGSILSNLLLVLGCCFVAGGYNRFEQVFNETAAQTLSSLLIITLTSLLIPAAFHSSVAEHLAAGEVDTITPSSPGKKILQLSRGCSIILLIIYIIYLVFQMKTHKILFEVEVTPEDVVDQEVSTHGGSETKIDGMDDSKIEELSVHNSKDTQPEPEPEAEPEKRRFGRKPKSKTKGTIISMSGALKEDEHLSRTGSFVMLAIVTVLVAFCADYLVDSIDSIVETSGMSKSFVGFVLIPIASNVCEHVTSVIVSMKNKMDLAIGVAVGSSIQIAMFVLPLLVLIGWWIEQPMSLLFTTFECCMTFITVFLVNSLINDGKSNYLEGAMLIGVYFVIATAMYIFPDSAAGV